MSVSRDVFLKFVNRMRDPHTIYSTSTDLRGDTVALDFFWLIAHGLADGMRSAATPRSKSERIARRFFEINQKKLKIFTTRVRDPYTIYSTSRA